MPACLLERRKGIERRRCSFPSIIVGGCDRRWHALERRQRDEINQRAMQDSDENYVLSADVLMDEFDLIAR